MSRKNKANTHTHTQYKQTTIDRMNEIKDKPAPHDDVDADAAALLSVRKTIQIVKRDRIEPIRHTAHEST